MEASVFARAAQRAGAGTAPAEAVQLDWVLTPFRAQRFYDLYHPAITRPLAYGAGGYLFYRSEDDSDHFVHMSFWSDRADFDRWWLSREMQDIRVAVSGLHGQPLVPHWHTVLERG
jgi:quinol monooxygenase YgiN